MTFKAFVMKCEAATPFGADFVNDMCMLIWQSLTHAYELTGTAIEFLLSLKFEQKAETLSQ